MSHVELRNPTKLEGGGSQGASDMRARSVLLLPALLIALVIGSLAPGCSSNIQRRLDDIGALETLKGLRSAENRFKSGGGRWGSMEELIDAGLVDRVLRSGVKDGYEYAVRVSGNSYEIVVKPVRTDDQTLQYLGNSFYLDESGVIRARPFGRANNFTGAGKNDVAVTNQQ